MIFDVRDADVLVTAIHDGVDAPFVKAYKSTLGGEHRVSVLVSISLDPRSEWKNGIYENSRYLKLHILNSGEIELISTYGLAKKFRKTRFKDIGEVVPKINKYLGDVK